MDIGRTSRHESPIRDTWLMTTQRELTSAARNLHRILKMRDLKVVFAESCTGGLVAATLTRIPGISQFLCGSSVVYQVATKEAWLGISANKLAKSDAVTAAVAEEMALNVLNNTPQADAAASVTGHLGPDAPPALDGLYFVGIAIRQTGTSASSGRGAKARRAVVHSVKGRLSKGRQGARPAAIRAGRQREAAAKVLLFLSSHLHKDRK